MVECLGIWGVMVSLILKSLLFPWKCIFSLFNMRIKNGENMDKINIHGNQLYLWVFL